MMALNIEDAVTLAQILRRWIKNEDGNHNYFFWDDQGLTLDGRIRLNDDELAALDRIRGGGDWWDGRPDDG